MSKLISLKKVSKSFSNNKKILVLKKINYTFEKGKVYFNDDIKDYLAKEFKHFNSQIIDLESKAIIRA